MRSHIARSCHWAGERRPLTLVRRTAAKTHRPLLATDPDGVLRRLRSEREPHYRAVATLTVPTGPGPAEDVATAILTHLEQL